MANVHAAAEQEALELASSLAPQLAALRERIRATGGALIAFSGGVDSALVLKIAVDVLGPKAVALTAISPSVPPRERDAAAALGLALGATHLFVESHELDDPSYAANPTNRCYFCKSELYDLCRREADRLGLPAILDGFNVEDSGDHRPGRRAGEEHRVLSPLLLEGLGKREIRALSRGLGLPTWDKPQLACLASRLPYGLAVTEARLGQVARAEEALQDLGLRIFRVRHHDEIARLEFAAPELARLFGDVELRERVLAAVKAQGYRFVALDLEPFRSGRMNDGLVTARLPVIA